MNKVVRGLLIGCAVLFVPVVVSAATSGVTTSPSAASLAGNALVTITIPGIIGIDVESDLYFDFSPTTAHGAYAAGSLYTAATTAGGSCGSQGTNSKFPVAPECTGDAFYYPQQKNIAGSTVTLADKNMWVSIFSSRSGKDATMKVEAKVDSTAFGITPSGTNVVDLRLYQAPTNNAAVNGMTVGGTAGSPTALTTSYQQISSGTATSSVFGWSRVDQRVELYVQGAATAAFDDNGGTDRTANIYLQLSGF